MIATRSPARTVRSSPRSGVGPSRNSCQTRLATSRSSPPCERARRGLSPVAASEGIRDRASLTPTGGAPAPAARHIAATGVCSGGAFSPAHWRKAWGEASHTIAPASIAMTLSAAAMQRSSRCSASSTVVPHSSLSRRSSQISSSPATGSSWEVGSSRSSNSGRGPIAAASATRCSSPPESSEVERSSRWAMPSASATSSTPRATSEGDSPAFSSGKAISPRTVVRITCVSGSWVRVPACAEISAGPCSRTLSPATVTSPPNSPP